MTAAEVEDLARRIDLRLRKASSAGVRKTTARVVSTRMEILGVAAPGLRAVVKQVSPELAGEPGSCVIALVKKIIAAGTLEGRQAAYEILSGHRGAMTGLTARTAVRLGRGMDNWGSVDCFGVLVAGPAWRLGRLEDEVLERWTGSPDRWWRRAALVATVALNMRSRGGTGDTKRTLRLCDLLAGDSDDMVVKGLSWALRALIRTDREAVEAFLEDKAGRLHARVKREVGNKLTRGTKA